MTKKSKTTIEHDFTEGQRADDVSVTPIRTTRPPAPRKRSKILDAVGYEPPASKPDEMRTILDVDAPKASVLTKQLHGDHGGHSGRFSAAGHQGFGTSAHFDTPNGDMPLNFDGPFGLSVAFSVIGGPFAAFRRTWFDYGVCLRPEGAPDLDLHFPIEDFKVPPASANEDLRKALEAVIWKGMNGQKTYVGCTGGWGRTGLFLALLAKVAGSSDPVGYVRMNYTHRAVETREQENFVRDFDVAPVQAKLRMMVLKARALGWLRFI